MKMKRLCFLLLTLLLFSLLIPNANAQNAQGKAFSDLSLNHWAFKEIQFLVSEGVISGYPNGTFRPENPVTRAEFAKLVLLSSLGRENPQYPSVPTFPDLSRQHWAFGYVEACAKLGWISGYPDGTFQPDKTVSKAEMVKIIVLSREFPQSLYDKDAFLDCKEEDWSCPFIQTALSYNILRLPDPGLTEEVTKSVGAYYKKTVGYLFSPDSPATRAQAAVLLYRMIFTP